jgi:L-ascorbate metabolism protein UlaG (beta-lactamase superfamily)
MRLQLIRNATLRLTYGGHLILIDPYFAPKHSLPSYANKSKNPLVDLPLDPAAIMQDVELVIVSHLHSDHFDSVAKELLPKDWLLFCQPTNEDKIREAGFQNVRPIANRVVWNGITITRTDGQHGEGETAQLMGKVSGFVFTAEGEPTVYWAGDTIWYEPVQQVIATVKPDIIVMHSCGAVWGADTRPIVMDAAQTIAVCQFEPQSKTIATHMEALDHATVSRADLRQYATEHGISAEQLIIPDDGETLEF